ncbi:MAG: T9SS type A sorting domain-containing protein [Candidatus Hydrogenedentota bacterium]
MKVIKPYCILFKILTKWQNGLRHCLMGIPLLLLLVCSNSLYALTPENTQIENAAYFDYEDEYTDTYQTATDTVTMTVGYLFEAYLSSDSGIRYGDRGESVSFGFYVENRGNAGDTYTFVAHGLYGNEIFADTLVENGLYDTGELAIDTKYFAINETLPIVFVIKIPDGAVNGNRDTLNLYIISFKDPSCSKLYKAQAVCSSLISGLCGFELSIDTPLYQYADYTLTITALDGLFQQYTAYSGTTTLYVNTETIVLENWDSGIITYRLTFLDTGIYTIRVVDNTDTSVGETVIIYVYEDTSTPIAPLVCPLNIKIRGNEVALISIFSDTLLNVDFEYRSSSSMDTWKFINNDTVPRRWGVYWNTDSVPEGSYELRVVGSTASCTDMTPGIYEIIVNRNDYDIDEYRDVVTNEHIKRQRIRPNTDNVTLLLDGCRVEIPAGIISETTYFRATVHNNAPYGPPNRSEITDLGIYRSFEFENGYVRFPKDIRLWMGFEDAGAEEKKYRIFTYDNTLSVWVESVGSYVNMDEDYVEVSLNHLSLFAVFGFIPATNLSGLEVYPNPWKPNDGDPNTGKEWTADDPTSGIIFANVTDRVRIQIYTIAGKLVVDRTISNTGGNVRWDVRNDRGGKVATGMYIAVITGDNGEKVIRKIMVIR